VLYHRGNGMWVLDFNRISEDWAGTAAYSEEQEGNDILETEWLDFPELTLEAVSEETDEEGDEGDEGDKGDEGDEGDGTGGRLRLTKTKVAFVNDSVAPANSFLGPDGRTLDDEGYGDELVADDGELVTVDQPIVSVTVYTQDVFQLVLLCLLVTCALILVAVAIGFAYRFCHRVGRVVVIRPRGSNDHTGGVMIADGVAVKVGFEGADAI